MTTWTEWLAQQAIRRDDAGLRRSLVPRGRADGFVDLAGNDYLGLSSDPRLQNAAIKAIEEYGAGARASRVVTGTQRVHDELESALCDLTGRPAALVFSTGYAANLGVLTALTDADTLIASDQHAHASLIDAARLSRAEVRVWPHSDLAALEDLLTARTQARAVVVVESIYSVLGDAADLVALAALCERHDAVLLVDEAHGIGVAGDGAGAVHAAGLAAADHVVVTATLSKALGAQGGAVLASAAVREHLVNTARSFIFDTGLAPASAAAATEACRIVAGDPGLAEALHTNAALIAAGCGVPRAAGAVQSITIDSPERAFALAGELEAAGVLVGCFRPPSVPDGISRLRVTARADLSPDEAAGAAATIATAVQR